MKKFTLTILTLILSMTTVSAQNEMSLDEGIMLPRQGNIALGRIPVCV